VTVLFVFALFGIAVLAGVVGAVAGLGGGVIVTPALTLLFGIDIRFAVGASIVAVIATSSGATIRNLRGGLCNVRIGLFLEIATATGAIVGAILAGIISGRWLYVIFGVVLLISGFAMLTAVSRANDVSTTGDALAVRIGLSGSYVDAVDGRHVEYATQRTALGLALMWVAGVVSGLLGIGSGVFKVPAMDRAMRLPIKVSTATSNYMIGVTGAATAAVYFSRGQIHPLLAGPVALGVVAGSQLGARLLSRLASITVRRIFVVLLMVIAVRMLAQGILG
jgi:uncharacterized protein